MRGDNAYETGRRQAHVRCTHVVLCSWPEVYRHNAYRVHWAMHSSAVLNESSEVKCDAKVSIITGTLQCVSNWFTG
jgi:hypothetical protein